MYKSLGFPLNKKCSMDDKVIKAAEKKLGVRFPSVLLDYYRVAGNETSFNHCFQRLLSPKECFVDQGRLVFMEENQEVVYWGVPASAKLQDDPPVELGVNGDTVEWYPEADRCSLFLHVMLCYQGAFGGAMQNCATAKVKASFERSLDSSWRLVGEVNKMRAFVRQGQAMCFLKWGAEWTIFAGASTPEGLRQIENDCGVKWKV
ncbi:MAG: hypothetical protein IPK83_24370 [Planctomycetes bacterium]|nr:hypothetical protein [Planctomycetota bacterium]